MKSVRLKQISLALCLVFSLFVSSVAACACSHHQQKLETDAPSCHQHSAKTEAEQNDAANSAETPQTIFSEAGCFCLQPALKVSAKSETVKVEKHVSALSPMRAFEIVCVSQSVSSKIDFSKPLYLSDSFYNLTPGRAPPRL